MWYDNEKLDSLIKDVLQKEIANSPLNCPICDKYKVNFYIHRYKHNRGGIWIWCSHCKHYTHGSITVPNWWINSDYIEEDKLTAIPEYLEEKRVECLLHVKSFH